MQQLSSSPDANLSCCGSLVCMFAHLCTFVDAATVASQLRLMVQVLAGFPGSHSSSSSSVSNSACVHVCTNSLCARVHQQPDCASACHTLPSNKLSDCFFGLRWRSGAQVNMLPGKRREAPPPPGLVRPVVTDRRQLVPSTAQLRCERVTVCFEEFSDNGNPASPSLSPVGVFVCEINNSKRSTFKRKMFVVLMI